MLCSLLVLLACARRRALFRKEGGNAVFCVDGCFAALFAACVATPHLVGAVIGRPLIKMLTAAGD